MRNADRTRADAGRFGTMYDEGACLATPALELIERANREASEARLADHSRVRVSGIAARAGRMVRAVLTLGRHS